MIDTDRGPARSAENSVFGQIVLDPSPESRKPHTLCRLGSRQRHRTIVCLASLGKTLLAALAFGPAAELAIRQIPVNICQQSTSHCVSLERSQAHAAPGQAVAAGATKHRRPRSGPDGRSRPDSRLCDDKFRLGVARTRDDDWRHLQGGGYDRTGKADQAQGPPGRWQGPAVMGSEAPIQPRWISVSTATARG